MVWVEVVRDRVCPSEPCNSDQVVLLAAIAAAAARSRATLSMVAAVCDLASVVGFHSRSRNWALVMLVGHGASQTLCCWHSH